MEKRPLVTLGSSGILGFQETEVRNRDRTRRDVRLYIVAKSLDGRLLTGVRGTLTTEKMSSLYDSDSFSIRNAGSRTTTPWP